MIASGLAGLTGGRLVGKPPRSRLKLRRRRWLPGSAKIADVSDLYSSYDWFTLSDAASELGVSAGRFRRLLEEQQLLAVRVDGELRVPALFVKDGAPLAGLRGTLISLSDRGVVGDEAMEWLLSEDASLRRTPLAALIDGHKAPVRRAVQLLAI